MLASASVDKEAKILVFTQSFVREVSVKCFKKGHLFKDMPFLTITW